MLRDAINTLFCDWIDGNNVINNDNNDEIKTASNWFEAAKSMIINKIARVENGVYDSRETEWITAKIYEHTS